MRRALLVLFLIFTLLIGMSSISMGESVEEFFEGKTISWIVPFSPGGGFDTLTRLLSPELEKRLGAKIKVENHPGAGGLIGSSKVYNSKPDGLTLATIGGMDVLMAEYLGRTDIDVSKFTFFGRINNNVEAWITANGGPYKSIADLVYSDEKILFSITGAGSSGNLWISIIAENLGINYEIVPGYPGSQEAIFAVAQQEVEATQFSWVGVKSFVTGGDCIPLLTTTLEKTSFPGLENTPNLLEVAKVLGIKGEQFDALKAVGAVVPLDKVIVAPPGLSEEKTEYLRKTLMDIMTDPAVVAKAESAGRPLDPLGGEKLAERVQLGREVIAEYGDVLKE